jgi:hypothetical protein
MEKSTEDSEFFGQFGSISIIVFYLRSFLPRGLDSGHVFLQTGNILG